MMDNGMEMTCASWRGIVGVVKPTYRPGSVEAYSTLITDHCPLITDH